jgi:hypothetical protein
MLYLVDREEEELSDKHQISVFEDAKYDDATLDNLKSLNPNTHYESMEICIDDEDMDEDDDDSS